MQSTNPPIHFSNHSTAHLRHIQPIIILYPTAAIWLTVGVRCVGGVRHRSAGWYAVDVDVASKKNSIPRNHEQNLSSREPKNAWKGIGGISILAAHTLRSVPNCDVKRSVTCHVLRNSPGSRNVGHEVPPSLKNRALRFLGVYILLHNSQSWRLNCNKRLLLKQIYIKMHINRGLQ